MATIPYYMNYVIFLQDEAEYNFIMAVAGGTVLKMAPRDAANLLGIPYPYPSGDMSTITKGIYFFVPFTPGSQFFFPEASGILVDDTVLTTIVPAQVGSNDGSFTWSGNLTLSKGNGSSNNPPPNPISQRRWIGGRELAMQSEGGSTVNNYIISRDSSRTIDGSGLCLRGNTTTFWSRNVAEFRTGLTTNVSWERFYIRVRVLPTSNDYAIWRCHGSPSSGAGFALKLLTTGEIEGYNINAGGTLVDEGEVFTPTLNSWYRIDILLKYDSGGGTDGRIHIFVNGSLAFTFTDNSGYGLNAGTRHVSTDLGRWASVSETEVEIDLDDWINADLPANVDTTTLDFLDDNFPIDWLLGSHVRLHYTISASQTDWTPTGEAVGNLNQYSDPARRVGTSQLASTTSASVLEGLTDAPLQSAPDTLASVLGAAAAIVVIDSKNSGSTDGELGYKKAGAAASVTSINQTSTEAENRIAYLPSSMILPDEISPWSIVHNKSADGNTDTTYGMVTVVEYLGVWGEEDDPSYELPVSRLTFLHNCRYGNTAWGYLGSQPVAPVFSVGGTYVGNGTYQEIELPAPCQFLLIRGVGTGSAGIKCLGAGFQANYSVRDRVIPNLRMWYDAANDAFKFSVVGGASSECNQSGITYQYIAFCDPGMRFNLGGQFAHGNGCSTPKSNPLITSSFLAEAAFVQQQLFGITSNVIGMWYRGEGHSNNDATPLDGTTLEVNAFNFAEGYLNTYSRMHSGGNGAPSYAYSLWRTEDSGSDGCSDIVMVQILSYIGDGTSSQVVNLTPASGKYPLFVLVCPVTNSASYFRDPSHTSNNSANISSLANSTTAITTVDMDQITVGSALNSSGVTYSVFVICGDTAGMNNGEFVAPYCYGDGPYITPEDPQGDVNILANGGVDLDGTPATTLLVDISGIYTLTAGKRNDTLYDRQTGQPNVDIKIPDPIFKTGYVGG